MGKVKSFCECKELQGRLFSRVPKRDLRVIKKLGHACLELVGLGIRYTVHSLGLLTHPGKIKDSQNVS